MMLADGPVADGVMVWCAAHPCGSTSTSTSTGTCVCYSQAPDGWSRRSVLARRSVHIVKLFWPRACQ